MIITMYEGSLINKDLIQTQQLTEAVQLTYDGVTYSIVPYGEWLTGKPGHDIRLKIFPLDKKPKREKYISYRIEREFHAVDMEQSHTKSKQLNNREVAEMRDLIGGLAQFDYKDISDYKAVSRNTEFMQNICDRFMDLSEEKQKEYIEKGKKAREAYENK